MESAEGWMDIRIDDQAQQISERLYNFAFPLHTGSFDNFFYKVLLSPKRTWLAQFHKAVQMVV